MEGRTITIINNRFNKEGGDRYGRSFYFELSSSAYVTVALMFQEKILRVSKILSSLRRENLTELVDVHTPIWKVGQGTVALV